MSFVAVFYGLVLAHFIADYMQPASLVAWTKRNGGGLYVHTAIYAVLSAVALFGSGSLWIPALLVLTVSHYGFDRLKYSLGASKKGRYLEWFLLDQACHGSVIVVTAFVVAAQSGRPGWFVALSFNHIDILVMIAAIIAAAFGGSIVVFEAARTFAPANDNRVISLPERLPGIFERSAACLLVFATSRLWLWPLAFSYSMIRVFRQWRDPSRKRLLIELISSVASFLAATVLFFAANYL